MLSAEKSISKIPKKGYSHSKTYLRYYISEAIAFKYIENKGKEHYV